MAKPLLVRTKSRRLLSQALKEGFTQFLLDEPHDGLGRLDTWILEGETIKRGGKAVGRYVKVRSRADEHRVRDLKGKVEFVVVEPTDWKVIPLENLIAALDGKTKLYAVPRNPADAKLFLETLEVGVDGLVIQPRTLAELRTYRTLTKEAEPRLRLQPAAVTRIAPVGTGERVCVDTANMFEPGEGLLVGNSSQGFFLVAAECFETEFVAARPFRVNAGAVHAYVWNGEATRYLSEIKSGLTLRAVTAKGHVRSVVVGRAKIETRPLVLVEAVAGGRKFSILLQNAETIRLVTPRGNAKSVSRLRVGDRVLLHRESGARHFGMKVQETIREV